MSNNNGKGKWHQQPHQRFINGRYYDAGLGKVNPFEKHDDNSLFNDQIKSQLQEAGYDQLKEDKRHDFTGEQMHTEKARENKAKFYETRHQGIISQALHSMLNPNYTCPKCKSKNIYSSSSYQNNDFETMNYTCQEKGCRHTFQKYSVNPPKLKKMVLENDFPTFITEEQKLELAKMSEKPKTKSLTSFEMKRNARRAQVLDLAKQGKTIYEISNDIGVTHLTIKKDMIEMGEEELMRENQRNSKVKEVAPENEITASAIQVVTNEEKPTLDVAESKSKNQLEDWETQAIDLFVNSNLQYKDISEVVNKTVGQIGCSFRKHKITTSTQFNANKEIAKNLIKDGKSDAEIMLAIKKSLSYVYKIRKDLKKEGIENAYKYKTSKSKQAIDTFKAFPTVEEAVKSIKSEKEIVLTSDDFNEVQKVFKTTNDPQLKEMAKMKLKMIYDSM